MLIPSNPIEVFLNIILVNNGFFFFNFWSLIHILGGMILYWIIKQIDIAEEYWQVSLAIIIGIILFYERFELYFTNILFRPEPIIDVAWDIIYGLLGWAIGFLIDKARD